MTSEEATWITIKSVNWKHFHIDAGPTISPAAHRDKSRRIRHESPRPFCIFYMQNYRDKSSKRQRLALANSAERESHHKTENSGRRDSRRYHNSRSLHLVDAAHDGRATPL